MAETQGGDAVRELARLVVSEVAPEEMPVYSVLADASLADPERMLADRDDVRERLGIGIGEISVLLTPYAILAAGEVVKYLTKGALDSWKGFVERLGRKSKHPGKQAEREAPPPLDLDQVRELRRIVVDTAIRAGLEAPKAELLADAFAGRLSASPADG